jgi:hypothetical protein
MRQRHLGYAKSLGGLSHHPVAEGGAEAMHGNI